MVDEKIIEKDFDAMAEFTGTAHFSYSDIHNQHITSGSSYDYSRVINKVSKLRNQTPEQTTEQLIDVGVLKYLPEGEFAINVNETSRRGGGVNFGGIVLFDNNPSMPLVTYHEYGHSLQSIYQPFDDKTMGWLYNNVGLDISKEDEGDVFDYMRYLHEMHADAFAYSSLLLRAKNSAEFLKISARAMFRAASQTIIGSKEKDTDYGNNSANSKYYASREVMKQTIRKIARIRALKKQKEYFNENGVINYEKVCDLARDIVLQSAYSPKQFEAFKDHKYNISFTKRGNIPIDHNHKWDIFNSKIWINFLRTINNVSLRKERKTVTDYASVHDELIADYTQRQCKLMNSFIDDKMPKHNVAKQSMERLSAGVSMLDHKSSFKRSMEDVLRYVVVARFCEQDFSSESQKKCADLLCTILEFKDPKDVALVNNFVERTDEIIQCNNDNEYFEKIMSYYTHPFYKQRDAMETLANNPQELKVAEGGGFDNPLYHETNVEKIKAYVELGVDIDSGMEEGVTPLMNCKNIEALQTLISLGAGVNNRDENGKTALAHFVDDKKVSLLLEAGADINTRDNDGNNPLMSLMAERMRGNKREKIVDILLDNNIDISAKNKKGENALVCVVNSDKIGTKVKGRIIRNLIAHNIDVKEALPFISDEKQKRTLLRMEALFKSRQQKIQQVKKTILSVKERVNTIIMEPARAIVDNKISEISTRISTRNKRGKVR